MVTNCSCRRSTVRWSIVLLQQSFGCRLFDCRLFDCRLFRGSLFRRPQLWLNPLSHKSNIPLYPLLGPSRPPPFILIRSSSSHTRQPCRHPSCLSSEWSLVMITLVIQPLDRSPRAMPILTVPPQSHCSGPTCWQQCRGHSARSTSLPS